MYIPTTFFGEGEEEFLIASGGYERTWVSGSYLWKSHTFIGDAIESGAPGLNYPWPNVSNFSWANQFYTTSFEVISGNTSQAKVLLVGGGGTDGINGTYGKGGGGGVTEYSNVSLESGSYYVEVGAGIDGNTYPAANGNRTMLTSSLLNLSVFGGGGSGQDGGSGGGANYGGSPGLGTIGQGYNGGEDFFVFVGIGGPGGGAGQAGGVNNRGGHAQYNGGDGKVSTLLFGVSAYYGGGQNVPSANFNTFDGFGYFGLGEETSKPGLLIISYPYKKISTFKTEFARFTPTIPSGTLEYVEALTGELRQYNFTTSASIDLCIVSGSQWNIYDLNSYTGSYSSLQSTTNYPSVYGYGTKTTLSINSCS